jgi:hypothetical protein
MKLFCFKIMVIEMLLNNDIQKKNCSNDVIFSTEINVTIYIIEFFLKKNSNHFIWTKSQ